MTIPSRAALLCGVGALVAFSFLTGCSAYTANLPVAAEQSRSLDPRADEPSTATNTVTILGSGDILIHNTLEWQAEAAGAGGSDADFRPLLSGIRARVSSADFAICHNEHAFSDPDDVTTFPHLYIRPQLAEAIAWTGFDECSTISNWAIDKGTSGIGRTLNALDAAGVGHAGTARTRREAGVIPIHVVKGVPIAHLAYAASFDRNPIAPQRRWSYNRIEPKRIVADARRARAKGAKIVVVSLHMGDSQDITPYEQGVAKAITRNHVVDLIICHSSHVVAPVRKVNGTWVVFGSGNTVSGQSDYWHRNREGLLSWFKFAEQPDGSYAVVEAKGYPILDRDNPNGVIDLVSAWPKQGTAPARWREAYHETKSMALSRGAGAHGFVVPAPGSSN